MSEWLRTVQADPHLPVRRPPVDRPAAGPEEVFRPAGARVDAAGRAQAEALLETVPLHD